MVLPVTYPHSDKQNTLDSLSAQVAVYGQKMTTLWVKKSKRRAAQGTTLGWGRGEERSKMHEQCTCCCMTLQNCTQEIQSCGASCVGKKNLPRRSLEGKENLVLDHSPVVLLYTRDSKSRLSGRRASLHCVVTAVEHNLELSGTFLHDCPQNPHYIV